MRDDLHYQKGKLKPVGEDVNPGRSFDFNKASFMAKDCDQETRCLKNGSLKLELNLSKGKGKGPTELQNEMGVFSCLLYAATLKRIYF